MRFSNLASRVAIALTLGPLVLFLVYLGSYYMLVLVALIALVSFYEYAKLSEGKGLKMNFTTGFILISALLVNAFFQNRYFTEIIIISPLLILCVELFRNKGSAIHNTGSLFLGVFYIGLSCSSLLLIRDYFPVESRGGYLIMMILISIWVSDSTAYFGGISFGKRKLMERVSPKKSWEGFWSGFIGAFLVVFGAKYLFPSQFEYLDYYQLTAISLIISVIGPLGDLIESLLKRDSGIKDSSNILGGHGGFFDRFDSLIAVSPVLYLFLRIFVK